ncbi:alpha/beta fold hydrolase [Cellulomonas sp. P24]|uniref:alpha/beta fold hydrolase n=1 Tax=Cellulomonas sp. P24 TaxID=2885206 RepID=UPI00216AC8CE|nr:alpha/beta hydrolase [Cellulomonas sp. P24]MCR6492564.1 alpha/beta hydrolase [Cellulomonas sp. P24]
MPTFLASDGASLHYDVLGDESDRACAVIVLAGGAARDPGYLGDLAGLTGSFPLVVPHLRGVGRSPAPDRVEDGSFWRQAEDIEALRVHLGAERVVVVGHSAGTRLAIAYATQSPHALAGLVLITPPAGYLVDEPSEAGALIDARRGEPAFDAAVAALEGAPDLAGGDDAFNAWQQTSAPATYASWGPVEQEHASIGRWHLDAARAFFSVEPPHDLRERIRVVSAPVLVIAGAHDCLTGVAPVRALAGLFPTGQIVVLERCGHYPWVEQPEAFRAAVDPFLTACVADPAGTAADRR